MATKVKVNEDVKLNRVTPRALAYVDANKLTHTNELYDELGSVDKAIASIPFGYRVQFLSELKAKEILDTMHDASKLVTWDVKKLEHGVFSMSYEVTTIEPKKSRKPRKPKVESKTS